VISIQENPFPQTQPVYPALASQKLALEVIRRNVYLNFSGISKQHDAASDSNPLTTMHVRQFTDTTEGGTSLRPGDGPSLLFYYLFDDWVTTYNFVARKEQPYGPRLDVVVGGTLFAPISLL
jgi:hypothetical protein